MERDKATHIQFDDLISKEKTKLKPLSVSVACDAKRRFILSAKVSSIGAFGNLAVISRKKYGRRKNTHKKGLDEMFKDIQSIVVKDAVIDSDEHKNYPEFVKMYFPKSYYRQFKSEKSSVAGQGELKKVRRDPLFWINHTLAMLRDGISTFVRRTWCVTQDPKRLHLSFSIL